MTETPDQTDPKHAALPAFEPVPRRFNRGDVWTEAVQREFIEALADTASVEAACRIVGRSPASAYRLRRHPLGEGFAAAWQAAIDLGIQRIEDYAIDRAVNGVELPVFYHGDAKGTRRVYNDQLVMFMLRSRLPERYCDGGARGLSAVDRFRLKRLKEQWRREWDAERRPRSLDEVRDSILGKLEAIERAERERWTPREHELHAELEAERARRKAEEADEAEARFLRDNPRWALPGPGDEAEE